MNYYSDNIVFMDAEFSDLEPYHGEIISIALIKPSGEELYLEIKHDGPISDWVRENIWEDMKGPKVSRDDAKERIRAFLGEGKPYMVGFVPQYDMVFLAKLFGVWELPVQWLPIDFASILFAAGMDPVGFTERGKHVVAAELGLDIGSYNLHHALDDARLLRDAWNIFFEKLEVRSS